MLNDLFFEVIIDIFCSLCKGYKILVCPNSNDFVILYIVKPENNVNTQFSQQCNILYVLLTTVGPPYLQVQPTIDKKNGFKKLKKAKLAFSIC